MFVIVGFSEKNLMCLLLIEWYICLSGLKLICGNSGSSDDLLMGCETKGSAAVSSGKRFVKYQS